MARFRTRRCKDLKIQKWKAEEMLIRKLWTVFRDFSSQMGTSNIGAHAASTAFFFFLSVVPMLAVISTVIPHTPLTEEDLVKAVTEITPDRADGLVVALVAEIYQKADGVMSLAVVAMVWSAGRGVLALTQGLNAIYSVKEERNYFVVRFVATLYTVVMLVVVILSLFLMVFGEQLVNFLLRSIPEARTVNSFLVNFRFILAWMVLTVLFGAVYAYVPNKKQKFRDQITGAAFAAVIWSIFSWGFSLYVDGTSSYSMYGSLSLIVILMVWLYSCMYIMMIGAYLNLYFQPENQP